MLKPDVYEEVEADTNATSSAALVVLLVSLAGGVGAFTASGIGGLIAGVIIGIAGWAVWAGITFFIGTRLLGTPETDANWGQLARTLGFAQAPGVLWIFVFVPILGWPLYALLPLWVAVAGFIAVRQALDIGNTKTMLTILVGLGVSGFLERLL